MHSGLYFEDQLLLTTCSSFYIMVFFCGLQLMHSKNGQAPLKCVCLHCSSGCGLTVAIVKQVYWFHCFQSDLRQLHRGKIFIEIQYVHSHLVYLCNSSVDDSPLAPLAGPHPSLLSWQPVIDKLRKATADQAAGLHLHQLPITNCLNIQAFCTVMHKQTQKDSYHCFFLYTQMNNHYSLLLHSQAKSSALFEKGALHPHIIHFRKLYFNSCEAAL